MEKIVAEKSSIRLDQYISDTLDISRSKVQKLIKQDKVNVNDKIEKASYLVNEGDIITVNSDLDFSISIEAKNIPIDIVYEDEYLMLINKKSGMVVHPAPGHYDDTLVNALLNYFNISETTNIRIGIVHRLDKDTSGIMMVAKNDEMLDKLSQMIKDKEVQRHYLALVDGVISPDSGTIDAPIGRDKNYREKMMVTDVNSKEAITHFQVLKRYKEKTLLECVLETGRTHQIRVHMAYIGYPITNDPVYNNKKSTDFGQMLHSKSIRFIHPVTGKEIYYEVDIPEEFRQQLDLLEEV